MLRSFGTDERGNVAIVVAIVLPILLGMVALVAEFGQGLLARAENQRVADIAAYAGAVAFSSSASEERMNATVARVASLNGIDGTVTATLVTSPRTSGSQAVQVDIETSQLLLLAPVLGADSLLAVGVRAVAELGGSQPGCIIALSGAETGVTLSGGTKIAAEGCVVASNASLTVPCGTQITSDMVTYNTSAPSQGCGGIRGKDGGAATIRQQAATDPFAESEAVINARARHSTVASTTAPTAPLAPSMPSITGGKDINFPWWNDPNFSSSGLLPSGCSASYSSGWIITCNAGATYTFGQLDVHHVNQFRLNGTAATTFNFRGNLNIDNGSVIFPDATYNFAKGLEIKSGASATFGSGAFKVAEAMILDGNTTFGNGDVSIGGRLEVKGGRTVTFGNGTFNIVQGINTLGGSATTFGAGTFNIGQSASSCSGARYSICNMGTRLTFGGPSNFSLVGGVYNNGGSILSLGSGTTNVYHIGASSNGDALQLGGGSKTSFADSLGSGTVFRAGGNINVGTGGGSCLTLPAAAQHDIKGNFTTAGGTRLGAGIYTVNGYVALGANGGGSVTCDGEVVGIHGDGVTFVISGSATPSSGGCAGMAFCVAAGYNNVVLKAPDGGATDKLLVVGPASGTAGAAFNEGADTNLSGAFYFPTAPILMSGGASISNGSGECLTLIGSRITLSGGTKAMTACDTDVGGSQTVMLVQ